MKLEMKNARVTINGQESHWGSVAIEAAASVGEDPDRVTRAVKQVLAPAPSYTWRWTQHQAVTRTGHGLRWTIGLPGL